MKKIILLTLFVGIILPMFAQKKKEINVQIIGEVVEEIKYNYLNDVEVCLLKPDSTVVSKLTTGINPANQNEGFFVVHIAEAGNYILKFSKKGYEDKYVNIDFGEKKPMANVDFGNVLLVRKAHLLEGVNVRATKIKMVIKNDTLVYNADAFQLAEGSMLDALISQLPGAELKDGQIKVNGRFIQSLLVNGKDFFKGNPKVALQNLPAYTVNKIKVYERENERRKTDPKDLVMDVSLKKQYSRGLIANAEAAGGSDERYVERLFGMYYGDRTRIAAYGSMDNINDAKTPGMNGEWSPQEAQNGQNKMKLFGMQWNTGDSKHLFNFEGNVNVSRQNQDVRSKSSTVNFLQDENTYGRLSALQHENNFDMNYYSHINYNPVKNITFIFNTRMQYKHERLNNDQRSATFNREPIENYRGAAIDSLFLYHSQTLSREMINQYENEFLNKMHTFHLENMLLASFVVKKLNDLNFTIYHMLNDDNNGNYQYSHYDLHDRQIERFNNIYRNRYTDNPEHKYSYSFGFSAYEALSFGWMSLEYDYTQKYNNLNNEHYRLERLKNWGSNSIYGLGEIPSNEDSLLLAKDLNNSYGGYQKSFVHEPQLTMAYEKNIKIKKFPTAINWYSLRFGLPLKFENEQLRYKRALIDTLAFRHTLFLNPEIRFELRENGYAINHYIFYKILHVAVDMISLQNYCDDVNPLNVYYGNSALKNTVNHVFNANGNSMNAKRQSNMSYDLTYQVAVNNITNSIIYDKSTGVTVVKPVNTQGNWSVSGRYDYSRPVDKLKHLQLSTKTSGYYMNSVELIQDGLGNRLERSSRHILWMNEELGATYNYSQWSIGGRVRWSRQYVTSPREGFETIHSTDMTYGFTGVAPLPGNLQFSTDFSLFTRNGYNDSNMNDNAWIWNARISKSILKGRLSLMLDAYDILNNIKNIKYQLTSMGRTETWYNSMNRYIMLHVIYKLNIQPKKK